MVVEWLPSLTLEFAGLAVEYFVNGIHITYRVKRPLLNLTRLISFCIVRLWSAAILIKFVLVKNRIRWYNFLFIGCDDIYDEVTGKIRSKTLEQIIIRSPPPW